ncbi:MAG: type II toxin-antitoxin system antitoxin SocA domain-containing protein [Candidatus Sulfotelmatobacter sp.]
MLSCFDVAKYFIALVDEDSGDSISNLKLQKLVYYAQGFHLAMHGEPLFPERILAWTHGPVVEELYHAYKKFGSGPIDLSQSFDVDIYSPDMHGFLTEVSTVYGQFTATKLRNMTHEEPPWKNTPKGDEIPHAAMRQYFKTLLIYDDSEPRPKD